MAEALLRLVRGAKVRLLRVSSVYETAPMGITEQPVFLNMVVCVETDAGPRELLATCLATEAAMGRVRRERWGPRSIDLDLLSADELTLCEPDLELPHPRIGERQFVLVPLAEIAPDFALADGRQAAGAARPGSPDVVCVGRLAEVVRREAIGRQVWQPSAASQAEVLPAAGVPWTDGNRTRTRRHDERCSDTA